jgi:hypothetical protein
LKRHEIGTVVFNTGGGNHVRDICLGHHARSNCLASFITRTNYGRALPNSSSPCE